MAFQTLRGTELRRIRGYCFILFILYPIFFAVRLSMKNTFSQSPPTCSPSVLFPFPPLFLSLSLHFSFPLIPCFHHHHQSFFSSVPFQYNSGSLYPLYSITFPPSLFPSLSSLSLPPSTSFSFFFLSEKA